jgi:DNA-binding NarL/FixJ family response regulator
MRVLVIDDHPLIQEIVPVVLAKALGEVVVATESTLEAGLARAAAEPPDLVLLDLGLPGCEALDAISRFRSDFPKLPIVVLSGTSDRDSILGALDEAPAHKTRRRVARLDLTERQREVLRLMLRGYNNERIAFELAIAPNTVKQHAHAIFTALGVSTRAEAVIAASRHGLR